MKKAKSKHKADQFYILSCGPLLKIGVTHNIDQRIKTLQTGNPNPILLEFIDFRNEPFKLESYLLRVFAKNRLKGEWLQGVTVRDIRVKMLLCTEFD